ncbi:MAG: hypothetical protein U0271_01890 [Polyangiaceae bacterium]
MQPPRTPPSIELVLSTDEALVFYEWLSRLNAGEPICDDVERRVLLSLEMMLEGAVTGSGRLSIQHGTESEYGELLELARQRLCALS